jgi:hypothetical protein
MVIDYFSPLVRAEVCHNDVRVHGSRFRVPPFANKPSPISLRQGYGSQRATAHKSFGWQARVQHLGMD